MQKIIFWFLILIPCFGASQSLGADRVQKLKESVVRILIEDKPVGTGFFVTPDGWLLTCWHVIEPAFIRDSISNEILYHKIIFIELNSGEKIEVGISLNLINKGYDDAIVNDYSYLKIKSTPKTKFSSLKLGLFENVNEGDAVYTCGYPLGIKQNFISSGIFSTKWTNTVVLNKKNSAHTYFTVNVAWLDLTMNKGNSGGPVLKIGENMNEDEVIGISSFILNPFAENAKLLADFFNNIEGDLFFDGISVKRMNSLFSESVASNSVGVSGCISINHFINGERIWNH